jgi:hypothetical protein
VTEAEWLTSTDDQLPWDRLASKAHGSGLPVEEPRSLVGGHGRMRIAWAVEWWLRVPSDPAET